MKTLIGPSVGSSVEAPTQASSDSDAVSFRVWARVPSFIEDERPWKLVACFRFLNECLEYIAYQQDHQCDVVYQSPVGCRLIRHTDPRVVYKAA